MPDPQPDWDTVMEQRAEMERDHYRTVCGDKHRWEPDERHAQEGYRCAGCGITEAELDREQYGRAYVDGDDWNDDDEYCEHDCGESGCFDDGFEFCHHQHCINCGACGCPGYCDDYQTYNLRPDETGG